MPEIWQKISEIRLENLEIRRKIPEILEIWREISGTWPGTLQIQPEIPKIWPEIHKTRLKASEILDTLPEFLYALLPSDAVRQQKKLF